MNRRQEREKIEEITERSESVTLEQLAERMEMEKELEEI